MEHTWIKKLQKYKNQQELIEKLYLPAVIDSYERVKKISGISDKIENAIRDEFHADFEEKNASLSELIEDNTLFLGNENRIPRLARRTDLSFFISGFGTFIIECKRMSSAETIYVTEGLERFTSGAYASNDVYGGMLAFVIGTSVDRVCNSTKEKVNKHLSFLKKHAQALNLKCASHSTSFQSRHKRKSYPDIHVYHIFLAI